MENKSPGRPTKAKYDAAIKAARGILRPKAGDASAAWSWADFKAGERELDDRREALRMGGVGKRSTATP